MYAWVGVAQKSIWTRIGGGPRHYVKSVSIWSFSGLYLPAFGLNKERYEVSLRIQSECRKIWTRKTPNTDTFYAVRGSVELYRYFMEEPISFQKLVSILPEIKGKPFQTIRFTTVSGTKK